MLPLKQPLCFHTFVCITLFIVQKMKGCLLKVNTSSCFVEDIYRWNPHSPVITNTCNWRLQFQVQAGATAVLTVAQVPTVLSTCSSASSIDMFPQWKKQLINTSASWWSALHLGYARGSQKGSCLLPEDCSLHLDIADLK